MKHKNSSDSYTEDRTEHDELDRLVQRALKALAGNQAPPDCVWRRIKAELEEGKTPRHRFKLPWLSLALQPAPLLLLIVLAGIVPNTLRPAGRELLTEFSTQRLAIEERYRLQGDPPKGPGKPAIVRPSTL